MLSNTLTYKHRKWYTLLVLSTLDFRLSTAKLWVWLQMFTPSCSNCEVSSLWPSAGSNPLFTWPHPTFTQLKVYAIQHKVLVCTTGYLCLPCPLPIASSNKSLQGKDPLAFPLPDQKCLELGNILSVFQIKGEILVLKKNVQFLEFFGFTLRFRTF